jgi:hypothetical protein
MGWRKLVGCLPPKDFRSRANEGLSSRLHSPSWSEGTSAQRKVTASDWHEDTSGPGYGSSSN